jgi:hypothetical protein
VRLDFVPPSQTGIVALIIEEASAKDGPFTQIERTTAVGLYPNYITYYTTTVALDAQDWFRIRWEDQDGIFSAYSEPLKGGTKTLVQEIVDRVLLREPALDERIVTQEAQAVVAEVMGTDDPNSILVEEATPVQLRGMTNLTLARSLVASYFTMTAGSSSKWVAGLVSLQSGTSSADFDKAIEALVKSANNDLGMGYSVILLMAGGYGVGGCATTATPYCRPNGKLHGVDLTRATVMLDYEVHSA